MRRTAFEFKLSDNVCNPVQEFFSHFRWLIIKQLCGVNSTQKLKLFDKYIGNRKIVNTLVYILKFRTDQVPEVDDSDSSLAVSSCVHHGKLDKASIRLLDSTLIRINTFPHVRRALLVNERGPYILN